MKSYSAAPIVTRFSRKETLWKRNIMTTVWNTLSWWKAIHSAPPTVTRDSHKDTLWKSNIMTTTLKHLVMIKSHSGAPIVTRDSRRETLWKSNMMSTSLKHLVMIKSHSGPAIVTRDSRRDPLNDDHKEETPFCCSNCNKLQCGVWSIFPKKNWAGLLHSLEAILKG